MTGADIVFGLLIVGGFFVAAAVSRIFRKASTGILIGGVAGLGVSVAMLFYSMEQFFPVAPDEMSQPAQVDE